MERIGRYVIRRHLIDTVFARLFLGWDEVLGRPVVIKVFAVDSIRPEPPFSRKEWLRRFLLEGHVMGRLDHPNLLGIHESGWLENRIPFLVLPFMPVNLPRLIGLDLDEQQCQDAREIERPRALGVSETLRILRQVLAGLVFLHARGMIHRDVKPTNILLSSKENGLVRLCDFGMVRPSPDRDMVPGTWMGSPDYISPEQRKDAGGVTDKADVYAAAATGWRMLTGRLPGSTPAPLTERLPGFSPTLSKAFAIALSPDPALRPSARNLLGLLAVNTSPMSGLHFPVGH